MPRNDKYNYSTIDQIVYTVFQNDSLDAGLEESLKYSCVLLDSEGGESFVSPK